MPVNLVSVGVLGWRQVKVHNIFAKEKDPNRQKWPILTSVSQIWVYVTAPSLSCSSLACKQTKHLLDKKQAQADFSKVIKKVTKKGFFLG